MLSKCTQITWLSCLWFSPGTETLEELVSTVLQRIGASSDSDRPQLLVSFNADHVFLVLDSMTIYINETYIYTYFQYEDDEGDKILLATDGDLHGAVNHARSIGRKVIFVAFVCHTYWIFISF